MFIAVAKVLHKDISAIDNNSKIGLGTGDVAEKNVNTVDSFVDNSTAQPINTTTSDTNPQDVTYSVDNYTYGGGIDIVSDISTNDRYNNGEQHTTAQRTNAVNTIPAPKPIQTVTQNQKPVDNQQNTLKYLLLDYANDVGAIISPLGAISQGILDVFPMYSTSTSKYSIHQNSQKLKEYALTYEHTAKQLEQTTNIPNVLLQSHNNLVLAYKNTAEYLNKLYTQPTTKSLDENIVINYNNSVVSALQAIMDIGQELKKNNIILTGDTDAILFQQLAY